MGKQMVVGTGPPAGAAPKPTCVKEKSTSLMDLPAEIRDRIYKLVLCPPPGVEQPTVQIPPSPSTKSLHQPVCSPSTTWSLYSWCPFCLPPYSDLLYQADHPYIYHPRPSDLSLLLVSKTIYTEAFHIFYRNRLAFPTTDVLGHFLAASGQARRQQITDIVFVWQGQQNKWAFRLLKKCRNLKTVTVVVHEGYQPPGSAALREVRGLEDVTVHRSVWDFRSVAGNWQWDRREEEQAQADDEELVRAMKRPKLKRDVGDPEEKLDLFRKQRRTRYTAGWIPCDDS